MDFCDTKKQYEFLKKDIDFVVEKVLSSGRYIMGEEVSSFEQEVAKYNEVKYAIAVGSGTDALTLSAMALGIKSGDEVITTPYTMIATIQGAVQCGAKPVFVDIDPKTFNIDSNKIEKKITSRTRAIFPVHFFGQPADMNIIGSIAQKHNLAIVEDVAQAMGAKFNNRKVGGFGDTGCLSFFPTKNLGGYGDGGMVLTNNEEINDKIKILRAHGSKEKYKHIMLGVNSRLDSIQAAILRIKLKHLDNYNSVRRKNASRYYEAFRENENIILPIEADNSYHVYHQYTIRVKDRNGLMEFLKKNNIPTMLYYPLPLHLQPVFSEYGYKEGDFPVAELVCSEVLSLPISPELEENEQDLIINKVKEFYN
ncbi:MAG: Pleiotropic regulatory protein [Candidatus Falkowbacteria bacterium GW2011_GWC2_38_22]|uniref:Pleiotropic regulatory protein n=1 Tax=Candidatus Falkowbacteria bacterium GW2011_GWE1_38_31 TaxID=1618638 RepID=A0A0G0JUR6_9BACT|nr:MAG: Pleiotropic regulatory protein [Candidatus Falkowbacteria bacterium GW2011_GWF2_38_1205]KKQ61854.1 MAG: Pleiotropic regulatory protein [Candidatus Falkowbacteria bacterium GW2011_GWC2_38_22]KKQ64162.1 MAG: Pleiotropic regulatory protein [Candidatus Falkowbacteria bacterium GW2011_GWF1_38_22]KKQ66488.1 MAG: Pleiotropic regulatory protein [Candidatus Falkowbacteria bacterium GW2011_GWE2_38_254]KKQ71268.1 MAG: Pleiotropic regulatory protein [Candidatus Falkowbacteria bacterium GW2011_GWE1_